MCVESRGDTAAAVPKCAIKIHKFTKKIIKGGKCHAFTSNKQITCASKMKYFLGKFPTVRRAQG